MVTLPLDPPSMPEEQVLLLPSENSQPCNVKSQPSLNLSLKSEFEPMETASEENVEEANEIMMGSNALTPTAHRFFPADVPVQFSTWPSIGAPFEEVNEGERSHHQVLKPIPVIPKEHVNVDELVRMSHLSMGETQAFPTFLETVRRALKAVGMPCKCSGSDLNSGKDGAIQVV